MDKLSPPAADRPAVRTSVEVPASNVPAWEMIEPGRYRPRRTRGSFPGRELG
jgi:hypothetical protein